MKLCVCVWVFVCDREALCGHRVTSPCQPLFYDVVQWQGSGTWHKHGEHAIGFEHVFAGWGSVTLRGSDRNSSALPFDAHSWDSHSQTGRNTSVDTGESIHLTVRCVRTHVHTRVLRHQNKKSFQIFIWRENNTTQSMQNLFQTQVAYNRIIHKACFYECQQKMRQRKYLPGYCIKSICIK